MKIVIVGGGKVGFAIAREVSAEGHDVTIIDSSRAVCDRLSLALDGMTVQGNGAALDVQHAALVPDSDLLIAVSPNDEANILACMLARGDHRPHPQPQLPRRRAAPAGGAGPFHGGHAGSLCRARDLSPAAAARFSPAGIVCQIPRRDRGDGGRCG